MASNGLWWQIKRCAVGISISFSQLFPGQKSRQMGRVEILSDCSMPPTDTETLCSLRCRLAIPLLQEYRRKYQKRKGKGLGARRVARY